MKFRVFGFLQPKAHKRTVRRVLSARPQLEVLEDRVVPALINHGGPVLSSVQAQALYLGAGWNAAPPYSPSQFDAFLSTTVNGATPYLAMLANAGFTGVTGAGVSSAGVTDSVSVSPTLTDAQIQSELASEISRGLVQSATANTLYFVFVQPNVVVDRGNGFTSTNAFLAYHSSFAAANGSLIRYAVIPFHGSGGNAQNIWLTSAFDSMTLAASHELAEAVTDPDGTTWFDRAGNEVGDIVNGSTVYLNSYAVQRQAALPGTVANFLASTPAGSRASHTATFTKDVSGVLAVNGIPVANPSGEKGQVLSISTQGIDDFGQPMTDIVFSDGNAYEYHDFPPNNPTATGNPSFFPWTSLGPNVKQAVAGQGVSYVLFTNGTLGEYVDPNYNTSNSGYGVNPGSHRGVIASGVTSILGAGTDQLGVNAVEYTTTVKGKTATNEWRDVTGLSSSPLPGFTPASSLISINAGLTFSTPSLILGDPDPVSDSPASIPADLPVVQFTLVAAGPVAVLPPGNGAVVIQPTALAASIVAAQDTLTPMRRPESGSAGNVVVSSEDDMPDDWAEPSDITFLPDTIAGTAPAAFAGPQAKASWTTDSRPERQPLAISDEIWAELGETAFPLEGQPLAVADEVWIARAEQTSLPVQEENASPALELAAVAVLPFVLGGKRRSRREQDRSGRRRLPFAP